MTTLGDLAIDFSLLDCCPSFFLSLTFGGSPRFPDARAWASSHRGLAGLGEVLAESCGNDVEDELALELDDNPGTTIGTTFSVMHRIIFPLLVRCGF